MDSARSNEVIDTELNTSALLSTLITRDEIPASYISYLNYLNNNEADASNGDDDIDNGEGDILKILQLYIFARNRFRGNPSGIKEWLKKGTLPGKSLRMSILFSKIRSFNKKIDVVTKMDNEINEYHTSSKKISKKEEMKFQNKEMKLTDLGMEINNLKDEITYVLDRYQTLIAPRSDQ